MASPLPQVLQALNNSNINVGGQTIEYRPAVGGGARRRPDPFGQTISAISCWPPTMARRCCCSDVAEVTIGNQPRLGIAGQDNDDDIVQGIVLMRRGEQSMPTIKRGGR